ncbi:MAG TPA: helix-turn-helix transcriptional regulator [Bacteroidales bacterium]|nr:helix-turn-helix transcriptional regulator [Bacteroidales bacterium]
MTFAQRLRLLIKSKNISQAELARKLQVTRGGVNFWLTDRQKPGFKQLMMLFEIFPEISADWLLLGRGKMDVALNNSLDETAFLRKQLIEQAETIKLYKSLIEEKDKRLDLLEKLHTTSHATTKS